MHIKINKMTKPGVWAFALIIAFASMALAQDVVIKDFPIGVAGSIDPSFFEPYHSQLQAIADTLHAYPKARAIITGGADGEQYHRNNDALNPGLALGRALVLRNLLIHDFKIDSSQIVIWAEDSKILGPDHRYASVRVDRELADLDNRLTIVENRPPIEQHITETKEVPRDSIITTNIVENLGLQFGAGLASTPFGVLPAGSFAISWQNTFYVEAIVGHTFWGSTFNFKGTDLDTKRRMIGGSIIYYPDKKVPIGIVGGWIRSEEISQKYYEYVRLSEGLLLGLRANAFDCIQITGGYNPSKRRVGGKLLSDLKDDQFMISVMAYKAFGGGK